MSIAIYLLDTSYLIELFGCGRDSNLAASKEVRRLFKEANASGARFFVPLPCLFELGDHIADVGHEKLRAQLAGRLAESVKSSLTQNKPWTVTPMGLPEDTLPGLLETFSSCITKRRIGLVDTFTVHEAQRLRQKFQGYKARVHIWTNDRILKAFEPDSEPQPYLW